MEKVSGGQALVQTLVRLGARRGFGVPGESYLAVLDAMVDAPSFDFTICRQEGGAAFMAEAWSKLTGEVGLCFVTRGPGATNAAIGVHSAMQASTPIILFVGQVGLDHKDREAFQEMDYARVFGSFSKAVFEIPFADRVSEYVLRAWTLAQAGRPGPVVVALPEDVLRDVTAEVSCKGPIPIHMPVPDAKCIEILSEKLKQAKRPLILAGGNGWTERGTAALERFASANDIPVLSAFRFHDVFDNNHRSFCGEAGVGMTPNTRRLLQQSDLILALNIRFGEMTTDAFTLMGPERGDQWIAHCHVSADEFGKYTQPDLAIVSGPNEMAQALLTLTRANIENDWLPEARQGFEDSQNAPAQPGDLDMGHVTRIVQKHMTDDAIITNGAGNFAIWSNKFLRYGADQRLLAPQSGAMGYGVPAAVAAKIECSDRQVVCFAGDGDFQMNFNELGTALAEGAAPVVLIVNNGTYGTIRMHQERSYPSRVSGTDLVNPDFATLARAYGMMGETITKTDQFEAIYKQALKHPKGAVLDLRIAQEAITPRQTIADLRAIASFGD